MKVRICFSSLLVAMAAAVTGCGITGGYNLPPASRLMEPGPGVGGPGPGVLEMPVPQTGVRLISNVHAGTWVGSSGPFGQMVPQANRSVQVLFARPEAMQISYDTSGTGSFDSVPIITPARQNFYQGGIYRLKIAGMPGGREGMELYPTLEIAPSSRRSAAYLSHNAIPVQFTEEDFDQVLTGNFVTKVIYLPDPDFQELALAGVETLVSTRLDPGLDPILEADRRGAILAVVRMGNKDLEIPGTQDDVGGSRSAATLGGVVPVGFFTATCANPNCDTGIVRGGVVGCTQCGGACSGGCLGAGAGGFCASCSTPRGGYGPGGLPGGLAGAGQYGMPITGTPIGLPGPPHVPLGVPAGLKKHVMHNWTKRHLPDPIGKLKINVKQRPGLSYPQPPNRVWVVDESIHPQPHYSHRHFGVAPTGLPLDGGIQADHRRPGNRGLLHSFKKAFVGSRR